MGRISREVHPLDAGMLREPCRHSAGVGTLALHAQGKSLDAAHGQIAFERTEHRSDVPPNRAQGFSVLRIGYDDAAEHIAVAAEVLGQRMHAEMRTKVEWT